MAHTQTPWAARFKADETYVVGRFDGIGHPTVCELPRHHTQRAAQVAETEANAGRIVACVNALEGVLTADLEQIAARYPTDPAARMRLLAHVLREVATEQYP